MISEQYIREATRIRKLYLENIKEIIKIEPKIMERKKSFEKIQHEMNAVITSDLNEIRKTLELNEKTNLLRKRN